MSNMQLSHNQQVQVPAFARQLIRVPDTLGNEGQVASLVNQSMMALGYDEIHVVSCGSIIGVGEGSHLGPALFFDGRTDVAPIRDPTCRDQRAPGQESVSKALSMSLESSCNLARTHCCHG